MHAGGEERELYTNTEASTENISMIFVLDLNIKSYQKGYKYMKHPNNITCLGNESNFLLLEQNGGKDDKIEKVQRGGFFNFCSIIIAFFLQDSFYFKQ